MTIVYAPIFTKEGNDFILLAGEFKSENKMEAAISSLMAVPLAAVYGFELKSGEPIEVDTENFPHISSKIGDLDIALIAGPIFDDPVGYVKDNPDRFIEENENE